MTLTDDRLDELFALAHPSPARETALRAQDIAMVSRSQVQEQRRRNR